MDDLVMNILGLSLAVLCFSLSAVFVAAMIEMYKECKIKNRSAGINNQLDALHLDSHLANTLVFSKYCSQCNHQIGEKR